MTGNRKLKVFYWTMAMVQTTFIVSLFAGIQFDSTTVMTVIGAHTANAIFFVGGNVGEHFANNGKQVPIVAEVKS